MKNGRTIVFALLLVALCIVGWWLLTNNAKPETRVQTPESRAVIKPAPSGVVEAPDDWNALEEPELVEMVEAVKQNSFTAFVEEGNSFVSQGVEVEPGVFRFTEISATMMEGNDSQVAISAINHQIDVSGNAEVLSAPQVFTTLGQQASIQVGSSDSSYMLELNPSRNAEGVLTISGSESYGSLGQ